MKGLITLVEIGNDGHRTAYMREFIAALLQLNYKVLCLIPDYKPIEDWVEIHYPDKKHHVYYISFQYSWERMNIPFAIAERIRILFNWRNVTKTIRTAEKQFKIKTDFVFINYIDFFLIGRIPLFIYNFIFPFQWAALLISSGIYYVEKHLLSSKPMLVNQDFVFTSPKFKALVILDEGILEEVQKRLDKKTLLFPDIADCTLPDIANKLYKTIKEKAGNRIVVGTIGLEPHKCGYEFLQLAKKADSSKYFFVFTGIFHENVRKYYNQQQLDEFDDFFSNLPENCLTSFGHVDEGIEYNSLFCSFDIVYLLYKNFYNSSNRLVKSSFFNKLVLSTNLGCIGKNVNNYQLGEVADAINIEEQIQKLELLRNKIITKDFPYDQWKIYSEKHSTNRLKEKFEELLNLV